MGTKDYFFRIYPGEQEKFDPFVYNFTNSDLRNLKPGYVWSSPWLDASKHRLIVPELEVVFQ